MPVKALKSYDIPARDRQEVFGTDQLLYFYVPNRYWFAQAACFRVPQAMTFQSWWEAMAAPLIAADPELSGKPWSAGQWLLNGTPWVPNPDQALAAQSVTHKAMLSWIPE
ncbi:MAG: phenol 2-monooxygenase [Sulfobacillus sp.]|nr:phenol 2-monooxygenase [Sulfobacillus sp.]